MVFHAYVFRASGMSGSTFQHPQCLPGKATWGLTEQHAESLPVWAAGITEFLQLLSPDGNSQPLRIPWWFMWHILMNTYGVATLWYITTWQPFVQHILPWDCLTLCKTVPSCSIRSGPSIGNNPCPSQTWAIKASPQTSCTEPSLSTVFSSPGTECYGQPSSWVTTACFAVAS